MAKKPFESAGPIAEELRAFLQILVEPTYRGRQIYHALYAEDGPIFGAMDEPSGCVARAPCPRGSIDLPKNCADVSLGRRNAALRSQLGTAAESENPNTKTAND